MKAIHKYLLEHAVEPQPATFSIAMTLGARLLHVEKQRGAVCLWAVVDLNETRVERVHFRIYGTGWPIEEGEVDDDLIYVGTFMTGMNDAFVWHLFRVLK